MWWLTLEISGWGGGDRRSLGTGDCQSTWIRELQIPRKIPSLKKQDNHTKLFITVKWWIRLPSGLHMCVHICAYAPACLSHTHWLRPWTFSVKTFHQFLFHAPLKIKPHYIKAHKALPVRTPATSSASSLSLHSQTWVMRTDLGWSTTVIWRRSRRLWCAFSIRVWCSHVLLLVMIWSLWATYI